MGGKLIVVVGPTGVGKSAYALQLAQRYSTVIISADSRQIYRGMAIGTDAPTGDVLMAVPHFFIQCREVWETYSADEWAKDALALIDELFTKHEIIVMVGGSMMYLQAFLEGFDPIPSPSDELRNDLWERFEKKGVESLRSELEHVDPEYLTKIDPNNHKRIIRALEVYHTTGQPFSAFHSHKKRRQFGYDVEVHHVFRERAVLYERINQRVHQMVADGLVAEAEALLPYRNENALNTIGYKEMFQYLDGEISLEQAVQKIAKNSRVYARQQENFFRRWQGSYSPFTNHTIAL